jgi:hypothetical protein
MSPQLTQLLAMLPEDKHEEFINRLPTTAATIIANEAEEVDEATLTTIAEAVWSCLEV